MRQLWVDTEYGYEGGQDGYESAFRPVLFCAIDASTGQRWHFWQQDPRLRDFVREYRDAEWVAHHALVEMQYLLRQGIPLPERWYCTMVAYRWHINHASIKRSASLIEALKAIGKLDLLPPTKKSLQQTLGTLAFDWGDQDFLQEVLDYCYADCEGTGALQQWLCREGRGPGLHLMRGWGEYLQAIATMELKGLPYDREMFEQLHENRHLIVGKLQDKVNETCPIYQDGIRKDQVFWDWVESQGIEWRFKTKKGALSMKDEALKAMETAHPFISEFRHIKKSLVQLTQRTGVFDGGRHYFDQGVFGTKTGRNSAKRFLLVGPKWMRWLATSSYPRDKDLVLVSADVTAQEIGIAGLLSQDPQMLKMAHSEDPHWYFARLSGRVGSDPNPRGRPERNLYKVANLAQLYGQTYWGLARRLDISQDEAKRLVMDHQRVFPRYWRWSQEYVWQAAKVGYGLTRHGWRCQWDGQEKTFKNYPIQGGAADQMRAITVYLHQQGCDLRAILHDGFVLVCPREELPVLRQCFAHALDQATRDLASGISMRYDFDIYDYRYEDSKGKKLWEYITQSLSEVR